MISLKNIAQLCGVSESTVSKALKNHHQIKVDTRKRIQEVAQKYNYQPNAMVECMQTGKSKTIGIACNKFNDIFAGEIMQGIHDTLYHNGYDTIVICWDMIVKDGAKVLTKFSRRRVDGLLIFPMEKLPSAYYLEELRNFHNPIVIIDQTWPGNEYDFVGSDNYKGAFMATEYMIKKGIKQIGAICYTMVSSGAERWKGFQDAMAKHNMPINEKWLLDINNNLDDPFEIIYEFLKKPERPKGLFCFNDNCAVDAITAANDLNISIPDELSLIGFGDLKIASKVRPRLTTVHQSPGEIGRKAAQVLLDNIKKGSKKKEHEINHLVDVNIVERNSVKS